MHPQVRESQPGKCPKCGMDLVPEGAKPTIFPRRKLADFMPLIVIFAVIATLTGIALPYGESPNFFDGMRYFEGFFFLVFGVFKLLNWKGFVDAYATYDLLAKRSRAYGYVYPLIELGLAAGYLFNYNLLLVSSVTLTFMIIGSIGVARELKKNEQIPCACLGVVFKIPMTWVTFIEDVLMALMAGTMIAMIVF